MVKDTLLDYRFSVAPMMDRKKKVYITNTYRLSCALRVQ